MTHKEEPSLAEWLAKVVAQLRKYGHSLLPLVVQKIIEQNGVRIRKIIHLDLLSALLNGIAVDVSFSVPRCLTIKGVDCEGQTLFVVVEIPTEDTADPLLIIDFYVP